MLITNKSTAICEGDFRIVHNGEYYKVQRLQRRGWFRTLDWVDQPDYCHVAYTYLKSAKKYVERKLVEMGRVEKEARPYNRVVSAEELR